MKLSVEHIRFSYRGGREVLKDISFTLNGPETLAILGPNGMGKSTLLSCLAGQVIPDGGRILHDGTNIRRLSPREFASRVAYIPQNHTPTFPFSVLDIVLMGRTSRIGYWATPGPGDYRIAGECLDFLGIGHLRAKAYTELSGGERQMVMIASALAQEAGLLLLDEPTAHLDFGNQQRFLQLVGRLKQKGIAVIMTTHFPEHALAAADCTAVLEDGYLSNLGPSAAVVNSENMSRLYRIPMEVAYLHGRPVCLVL